MRAIVCPRCGSRIWTTTVTQLSETTEMIQSHWNASNSLCPASLTPVPSDVPEWVPDAPPVPPDYEAQIKALSDVVDQLILDNLMGGM